VEASKREFLCTLDTATDQLIRVYDKEIDDTRKRIRLERQESPYRPIIDALHEKLDDRVPGYIFEYVTGVTVCCSVMKIPVFLP
jgi:hypothetical protein